MNEARKLTALIQKLNAKLASLEANAKSMRGSVERNEDGSPVRFQGQRDLGPDGMIPENPTTKFERFLHVQRENMVALSKLGGPQHDRVIAAVRQGFEIREQMEKNHLLQIAHDAERDRRAARDSNGIQIEIGTAASHAGKSRIRQGSDYIPPKKRNRLPRVR